MKTLYLDCGMGAAGDMLAAALLELVPDPDAALADLNSMGIPGVRFERVAAPKCGIAATRLAVTVDGVEEDAAVAPVGHGHQEEHDNEHGLHEHEHNHHHHHGHGLNDISNFIDHHLSVPEDVKADVRKVYAVIADAEGRVHGKPVDQIHFHEVGTLDAIADIAAVSLLVRRLAPDEVVASPVHVGSGTVKCAHGVLPVPAPATAQILCGVPTYSTDVEGELCTPTGAALLRHFATRFGPMPEMSISAIGYGAGSREFPRANILRAMMGESTMSPSAACGADETVFELACEVDDMTGEEVAFACERLFAAGARDVSTFAVGMKKGRLGTAIRILCMPGDAKRLVDEIFRHTTTLGVRGSSCMRWTLSRRSEEIPAADGGVMRRKTSEGHGVMRSKIEYDDAARVAVANGITLREARG